MEILGANIFPVNTKKDLEAFFQKVVRVENEVRIDTVGRGTVQFLMLMVLLAKGGKPHVTQK